MANKKELLSTEVEESLTNLYYEFGQRVKALRRGQRGDKKINQADLGHELGLSLKNKKSFRISKIENGYGHTRLTTMMKIASFFGYRLRLVWEKVEKTDRREAEGKELILHNDSQEPHNSTKQTGPARG